MTITNTDILIVLQTHKESLNANGVLHAWLFGSRARADDERRTDIIILVELDPHSGIDLFRYAGIKSAISELFTQPVDVVNKATLKAYIREEVLAEAISAF